MTPVDPYFGGLEPRFGAAGILLRAESTDRYLFLHDPFTKQWGVPGGGIKPGETPIDAALREFREEVGPQTMYTNLNPIICGPPYWLFKSLVPDEFRPRLSLEHNSFVWARLDAHPEPLHPGLRSVVR